ncbi:hypothetical protein [Brevibacillus sp. SYSU BS000544]|uniref:hypothetical protein n=1 Tax=Brevibacillus sp. SYSU BS000544 TaxID=3416443 RepID=UPI003CE50009
MMILDVWIFIEALLFHIVKNFLNSSFHHYKRIYDHGDIPHKLKLFSRIISLDQSDSQAFYFRGMTKFDSADFLGAIEDSIKDFERASSELEQAITHEALEDINTTLKITPDHTDAILFKQIIEKMDAEE